MPTVEDKLETLFAKVRMLLKVRQELDTYKLTEGYGKRMQSALRPCPAMN